MPDVTSEEQVQEEILTFLNSVIVEKVVEQGIPNSQTVLRDPGTGNILPYVAVQFGDTQQGLTHSMIGPVGDDYVIPVYTQVIAADPRIARRISNRIRLAMIGKSFQWTGSIRKRPGGGMFPLTSSNGATEAYMMPASFGVPLQFTELPLP